MVENGNQNVRRLYAATGGEGKSTDSYLEVLDAQRQLFEAELSLAGGKREHLVATVQLDEALGATSDEVRKRAG